MIWIATYKDGTVLRQYDMGKKMSSEHLDRDKLESFRITETSGDTSIQFSADSGVVRFSNINFEELIKMEGGEKLTLVFDKKSETFKMDNESLQFFNSIALKDEREYFFIEFNQTGEFYVGGQPFFMGYILDGEEIPFKGQPPYNDFEYKVTSNDDFYMSNGSRVPSKKASYITGYSLKLSTKHVHKGITFNISYEIMFDVLKSCVLLDCLIGTDTPVEGSLFMVMGGERTANPINFSKGDRKQIRRMLTLL